MKIFKCFFTFDNGVIKEKKKKFVFSDEGDKEHIQRILELHLFDSNDCLITDLTIMEMKIYEGMVIA